MLRLAVLLAVGLAGCSDDDGRPPGAIGDASIDATVPTDGPAPDAARTDAGPAGCTVGEVLELARDGAGGGFQVAAAGGPELFAVVWTGADEGAPAVAARIVPSDGPPGERLALAEGDASGPAVAAMDGAWIAAWSSAGTAGSLELFARSLPTDGSAPPDATRVTDDAIDDAAPTLVGTPSSVVAAWLRGSDAVAGRLGADGTLSWGPTVLGEASGASEIGLGRLDDRFFAGWATAAGLQLRVVRGDGDLPGTVTSLPSDAPATGQVALAGGSSGGAALYGLQTSAARRDLRLQHLIAPEATASTAARLATVDGVPGHSPALVRFAGAWAGAWRAGMLGTHHVRLGLFAIEGDVLEQRSLAPLGDAEGALALAVASDGTLLVVWGDGAEDGASLLQGIRIECRG